MKMWTLYLFGLMGIVTYFLFIFLGQDADIMTWTPHKKLGFLQIWGMIYAIAWGTVCYKIDIAKQERKMKG